MAEGYLVRGRWVVTGGGDDDAVHADACVVVEGDSVVAVEDYRSARAKYPAYDELGSDRVAVMPGLINAHHHSHGASRVQHGIPDLLLEPWILAGAGGRGGDVYLDTLLSAARQLKSGVTAVVDVHSDGGPASDYAEGMRSALRAYDECGMRVAFAPGTRTQSFLVHGKGQDEAFLAALPEALGERARSMLPAAPLADDEYLGIVEEEIRRHAEHPRIDVWFGPPGPQWVSDELMQRIAERAEALDTNIQTHCNESFYEMLHGPKFYGQHTVSHLKSLGVLSDRFSLAHGVWLNEREIEVLAETGAAVSHNPSSNLRLRAGVAPLNAFLAAGATVAIGMDGTAINDDEDMFNEMRLVMRLHRTPQIEAPAPTPARVLELATEGGAKLMRKAGVLGKLAPGFKADLALVDLGEVTWPWVAPETDPRELLLMRASARHVETVMVGGEVVLEDGEPCRYDARAVAGELARLLDARPYPAERARLVADLIPHLEAWYGAWEAPPLEPYAAFNTRR